MLINEKNEEFNSAFLSERLSQVVEALNCSEHIEESIMALCNGWGNARRDFL